jgi:DNA repair ATPase RecN
MKKGNLKEELKGIYSKMLSEYENAKKISVKINEINKMLSDPDWDLDKIQKNIQREKDKIPQDPKRLERMYEMHSHIQQLHEKKSRLCNQISDLNISFQTIYTKLTLLDIQEESNFDEIETEIRRILDFKLKVDQYEEKLDRELKEFL